MTRRLLLAVGFGLGLAAALAAAAPVRAQEPLRVCLDAGIPPWSMHTRNTSGGFDLRVADALAARLGRKLAVQWFETSLDEDSSTASAANALLSDHRCQMVGGYPLVESALAKPASRWVRMPDFVGARPADRGRLVALGSLAPSRAYSFAALTVVMGPTAKPVRIAGLADLKGMKIGVEGGTLADAALMLYDGGELANRITHVVAGRGELLPRLENGDYDVVLVALRRFDAYRTANPQTKLTLSGYYLPIGFNMGFVGLASDRDSLAAVDRAIAGMLEAGEPAALAKAAGVTYLPPREPNVSHDVTMSELRRN
jgi:ABC-type amino acid transport substrate-binding protein